MSLQCVAHFWCSAVTVCFCGFLRCLGLEQKIDSNITLLPLPPHGMQPSDTHKHTHVNHIIFTLLAFVVCGGFLIHSYLFMCDSFIHCVLILESGLSFTLFTSCFFFSLFPSTSVFINSLLSLFQSHVAAGSGEPGGDEYHSLVLYHNNSPRWAEQIKLPIPVDMFRGSHVRFEFRHCSSKWEQDCYLGTVK